MEVEKVFNQLYFFAEWGYATVEQLKMLLAFVNWLIKIHNTP